MSGTNACNPIHTIPSGVRKRVLGELKGRIQECEQHDNTQSDEVEPLLKDILQLIRIGEVFSPPRFTKQASQHGFTGGRAFDLVLGDDLLKPEARRECLERLAREKYDLVVVTPPCTMFSMLQFLGSGRSKEQLQHDAIYQQRLREAKLLLTFAIVIYLKQQHSTW